MVISISRSLYLSLFLSFSLSFFLSLSQPQTHHAPDGLNVLFVRRAALANDTNAGLTTARQTGMRSRVQPRQHRQPALGPKRSHLGTARKEKDSEFSMVGVLWALTFCVSRFMLCLCVWQCDGLCMCVTIWYYRKCRRCRAHACMCVRGRNEGLYAISLCTSISVSVPGGICALG